MEHVLAKHLAMVKAEVSSPWNSRRLQSVASLCTATKAYGWRAAFRLVDGTGSAVRFRQVRKEVYRLLSQSDQLSQTERRLMLQVTVACALRLTLQSAITRRAFRAHTWLDADSCFVWLGD